MKFLNGTKKRVITLHADDLRILKWYVDTTFAVHPDFKSHTSVVMKFQGGKGAVITQSLKQKINAASSTTA